MKALPNTEAVCLLKDPLDWTPEKSAVMVAACRELAQFHYEACADIRGLYDLHGFDPASITTEDDLARIPSLGVAAMKQYLFTSLPHEQAVLRLTSSGTRGQKTQIWFDEGSLRRVQSMLDVYLEQEGIVSSLPTNYLVFNYDPEQAGDLGIAYSEKNQLRFAPVADSYYAVRKNAQGEWALNYDEAMARLERYAEDDKPVRIFAMPAFLFEFLRFMQSRQFKLPAGSLILTGGGWKAAEDKKVSRDSFRAMCADAFGIPEARIRDAYGMAEHSAPYFECSHHKFHIAVYNRLIIRDPATMAVLPAGQKGLLELVTPYNTMMPNLAILSTDWAMIDAEPCGCGQNSPTFQLLGRAGISKHKGCALHADDIVKRRAK